MISQGKIMILAGAVSAQCATAAAASKPNILYINADDLGVMCVGFDGDKRFDTPNLDRLAASGMIFTNAFSAAANCAPSRACVLTGQVGPRHGVYTVSKSTRGDARFRKLVPIKNNTKVPLDKVLIPEALKKAGYTTVHIGKWHIGSTPLKQGFDISVGGGVGVNAYGGYYGPFKKSMAKYNEKYPDPSRVHVADIFVDEAVKIIKDASKRPFFMEMDFHLVHSPHVMVREFKEKYQSRTDIEPAYLSMVAKLDQEVGRLAAALDAAGIAGNTLVVFTSDNGGIAKCANQHPYRAGKGSYYDGGVRVPFFAVWPGRIPSGSKSEVPIIGLDFYPTFLAAAGVAPPSGTVLDGVNMLPVMTGKGRVPERDFHWHFPIYLQAYGGPLDEAADPLFRTRPGSLVMEGKWRLLQYFEDGRVELYDTEKDIGERVNLADKMPEKAAELLGKLEKWRKSVNAPIPTEKNPKYDSEAEKKAIAAGGVPKRKKHPKKKKDKKNKKNEDDNDEGKSEDSGNT